MSHHFHSISNVFDDLKCHHHGQFQFVNEKKALIARSTLECDPEWEFKSGVSISFHTISVCILLFFSMKFTHSVLFCRVWVCRLSFFVKRNTWVDDGAVRIFSFSSKCTYLFELRLNFMQSLTFNQFGKLLPLSPTTYAAFVPCSWECFFCFYFWRSIEKRWLIQKNRNFLFLASAFRMPMCTSNCC